MKIFFSIAKKSALLVFLLCFTFTAVYIPQPTYELKKAYAGGGWATEFTQALNNIQLGQINVYSTIAAGASLITSSNISALQVKEYILDGIAFTLVKNILSAMTRSIVRWINSGFQGSPAFVQDLEGFLFDVADRTFGEFLYNLGGPFSMVCSPFRLDVQLAISLSYARLRDPARARCTLTGALANIESFLGGNMQDGGWPAWFDIVSQPNLYTPYGAQLSAEIGYRARILNAQGRELEILGFGSGFQSSRICQTVTSAFGGTANECFISTPGRVISEALTFQLSTGPRALIEADEINEIIGALLSQLAQTVLSGTGGLIGSSNNANNRGFVNPTINVDRYAPGMDTPSGSVVNRSLLVQTLAIEQDYLNLAVTFQQRLNTANYSDPSRQMAVERARDEINLLIPELLANIVDLQGLITAYDNAEALAITNPSAGEAQRLRVINDFTSLRNLHTRSQVEASEAEWSALLK